MQKHVVLHGYKLRQVEHKMSEFLLEIFSEEIPARMQAKAAQDLQTLMTNALKEAGLEYETSSYYFTPRRLTLVINGLPNKSPDISEERKGPRVGAPEKALQGFMRGAGISSIEEAEIVSDPKKGDFYVVKLEKPGQPTSEIIAAIVPETVRKFPWQKSMRWGTRKLRWVRPLHSILCVLNGKTINFEIEGIKSDNITYGHRFMAPKSIKVKNFSDYQEKLLEAKVILDHEKRKEIILQQAKEITKAQKLKLIEDVGLLSETANLVEWPTVLIGEFDKDFLDVPPEVLSTSMKEHQKCFSLKKGKKLANKFLLVSNLIASDEGVKIINGNERVIRARLSDAKFFWDNDKNRALEDLLPKLELVTFHEKLGTQAQRVERLKMLSKELVKVTKADKALTQEAANLCKADLMSEIVYEFPELQGLAGQYIATKQGKEEVVSLALVDHYKPQGQSDDLPNDPVSITVSLADKLDTLIGFWAIDEKPTGSKDPFALRRAALGIIRIVLEHDLKLPLKTYFSKGLEIYKKQRGDDFGIDQADEFLSFFADRLKVYLRDKGIRHDLIDSVFSLGGQDDLLMIVKRVEALTALLQTDDGVNLLAGVKRASNILRIEEKKDKKSYQQTVDEKLLSDKNEKLLFKSIVQAKKEAEQFIKKEKFQEAMTAIAKLRTPVDTFFDDVIVNDENKSIRENRLNLLSQIRETTREVADFSKIEG